MTKILSTIGPASEGKKLKYFIDNSDLVRLNMSHNSLTFHKKNIKEIKKTNPNMLILVDIPGIKPRTTNKKTISIKKGQEVKFSYRKFTNSNKIIPLSNPLPNIKKKSKIFYLSDGSYEFKNLKFKNQILSGIACQSFDLKPYKGLNIPFSIYNDIIQEKLYFSFIKKIYKLNIDCIGISFIQNPKILLKIKKQYPKFILISKIENYLGYQNRKEIINNSDAVMIDRGDLAAEVGVLKLSEFSDNIIYDTKKMGKSVIIATENLNSLIFNTVPTKSDIVNIEYYIQKKIDYIMLSDETATSNNSKNTIKWLRNYIKNKQNKIIKTKHLHIEQLIKNLNNQTLVVFSKKGYIYDKISKHEFNNLIMFTENIWLKKILHLKKNHKSIFVKFPKKYLYGFLYENIKKNKHIIFNKNKYAYLLNVIFPRKNSRLNTISVIEKKDF